MREWISDIIRFLKSVIVRWFSAFAGTFVTAVWAIYQQVTGKPLPMAVFWLLVGICVLLAGFLAWRDEYKKAKQLEERMKSRIGVTCGRKVEMSILTARGVTFFRARLHLVGIEPVRSIEAAITAIRRDGKKLPLDEAARLTLHPGYPVLDELREGTPEFIDVLKVEEDGRLALALIGTYPAVDTYSCNESGHTYELDVSITGSTRTRMCTFVFVWTGDRDTADFHQLQS